MLIDASFPAKPLNIRQFVDSQSVLLVEGDHIKLLACGKCLGGGGKLNERKSRYDQYLFMRLWVVQPTSLSCPPH
jgi:hypothetical protein